jgi:hypothetical protein
MTAQKGVALIVTGLRSHIASYIVVLAVLALASAGLNCASDTATCVTENAEVYLVVTAGEWDDTEPLTLDGGPVPAEDIESFLLTVDRIILKTSADEDSTEAEEDSTEHIVVFDASGQPAVDNEIDLVDLTNLSDILFSAEVPPDDYAQIRMEITGPHLRLVGDPAGEYRTNVSLTANGRLFANVDLAISPGERVYLHLILDRIHLIEKGNGDFVLTPKLGVEILPTL